MQSIASRLLMSIGVVATVLFIAAFIVVEVVKQGMVNNALKDFSVAGKALFELSVDQKLHAGVASAVALADSPNIHSLIAKQDYTQLAHVLTDTSKAFAKATEYKNIQFLVLNAQGQFLYRSYVKEPDSGRGKDATYRAGVKEVLSGAKAAHAGIDLSSGGLVLSSMVPVDHEGQRVGVFEFRSGFGSINDELIKQNYNHIALLNSKALETYKNGRENKAFGSYVVAHNKHFRDSVQQWYAHLDVDKVVASAKEGLWQDDQRMISVDPIKNAAGDLIGYHLIGFDKSVLFETGASVLSDRMAELNQIVWLFDGIIIVLVFGIMLIVAWGVRRQVSKPLREMEQQLSLVAVQGEFNRQLPVNGNDEIAHMTQAVNQLLASLSSSLSGVNNVLTQVAQGDFRQRITEELPGDLGLLKLNLNTAVETLQDNMKGLSFAMTALSQGQFDHRMPSDVEPKMRQQVDGALQSLSDIVKQISVSMSAIAAGDFSKELVLDAQGEWVALKESVNGSVKALRASMDELAMASAAMAKGDLRVQIQGQYAGELGRIAQAFNHGISSLQESMLGISRASVVVSKAAVEVANGNNDLSSRTQSQALSLEKTASTMTEMTQAIAQTADNAEQARLLANNTQQAATQGVSLMDQTVQAMREIGEANQKITAIVSLIDSIAFQTNLLALNAAVEAARAGEHGRGFAVVASEVRALAGKSADAAKDIKVLIDRTIDKVSVGDQLVEQTVEAFANIQKRLAETDQAIASIANAMREQRSGITQVNQSISDIDQSTQQNAALVEQTSAAAETMRDQADEVATRVSRFQLNEQKSVKLLLGKG
jgi:methyl-accepting chemotaxis protein